MPRRALLYDTGRHRNHMGVSCFSFPVGPALSGRVGQPAQSGAPYMRHTSWSLHPRCVVKAPALRGGGGGWVRKKWVAHPRQLQSGEPRLGRREKTKRNGWVKVWVVSGGGRDSGWARCREKVKKHSRDNGKGRWGDLPGAHRLADKKLEPKKWEGKSGR